VLLWAVPLLLAGCARSQAQPVTARFTESGVEVTIRVSAGAVRAVYRPTRSGFHVYSVDLPALGVRLPTYPDGPVTVSLPVRRIGPTADIVVSYAACSSGTCLAPVTGHVTTVTLH
jgi:hypothetical protein